MDYEKRGYLNAEFKLFHLTDCRKKDYSYHYHDFYKLLVLLSGNVSYTIEGKTYQLKPYDIVFVNAGEIHRPSVHDNSAYERMILYLSPAFLAAYKTPEYDLEHCFLKARQEHSNVLRLPDFPHSLLYRKMQELIQSAGDEDYAHSLYHRILLLEFMIQMNRAVLHETIEYIEVQSSNEKIMQVLNYIKDHLTESITPDSIASQFYLNKYYLMHLFRDETGYTLGSYITNKRLLYARSLLQKSIPATQVCYDCGFQNYSTFLRAYKKCFHEVPTRIRTSKD